LVINFPVILNGWVAWKILGKRNVGHDGRDAKRGRAKKPLISPFFYLQWQFRRIAPIKTPITGDGSRRRDVAPDTQSRR
jgi:hypothetical protein